MVVWHFSPRFKVHSFSLVLNAKIDGSPELLYHAILLPLCHIIVITVPDDLPSPDDHDLTLLLATVIVAARPAHLMATLNYADLFAWSVPIDMM